MAKISERLASTSYRGNQQAAKMVNAPMGGQLGPMVNNAYITQGANYVKQDLIARVIKFPEWFDSMDDPKVWREAFKSFIEVTTKISGITSTLSAEYSEITIGGTDKKQYDLTDTKEAQSIPVHELMADKVGMYYTYFFETWIRMMKDPQTKQPLLTVIDDTIKDALPDRFNATILYYEPDASYTSIQNAWLLGDMRPKQAPPREGRKDNEAAGETVSATIEFTGVQQVGDGVLSLAYNDLQDLIKSGLDPLSRQAFVDDKSADVKATAGGYHEQAEQASNEQV